MNTEIEITADQNNLTTNGRTLTFVAYNYQTGSPCDYCSLNGYEACAAAPCTANTRFDGRTGFYTHDPLIILREDVFSNDENERMVGRMVLKNNPQI